MTYAGRWNIVMKTPMGDREAVLNLTEEGGLSGESLADGESTPIKNGRIEDGRAKFEIDLTSPMPITLEFDLEADGDSLSGNVKLGMFGNSSVNGARA
jgi:hypothetical protein